MRDETGPQDDVVDLTDMMENQFIADDDEGFGLDEYVMDSDAEDSDTEMDTTQPPYEGYEENQIKIFKKHRDAVLNLSLHPVLNLAVSGGVDDKAYVWDTITGQVYYEIEHTDSVTQVHFSYDGKYLATGDMAGSIVVYGIAEETVTNDSDESEKSLSFTQIFLQTVGDIEWMHWHFGTNVLLAGAQADGEVYMWRIPNGDCKIMAGIGCAAKLGGLTEDGKKLVCVYENGTVKLWDAKTCQAIYTYTNNVIAHENPEALAVSKDSPIFAVGVAAGYISFYTYTAYVGQVKAEGSVEDLVFAPASSGLKVCISCTLDGQIAVWDYARMQIRNTIKHTGFGGLTSLVSINDFYFAAGSLRGDIQILDIRKQESLGTLHGHRQALYALRYDPKNNWLLSASEDRTVRTFQLNIETTV